MKSVYFEFNEKGDIVRCSNAPFGDECVKFILSDGQLLIADGERERIGKMAKFNAEEWARKSIELRNERESFEMKKERELADIERIKHNIMSDAGKIRMAAYNDAAKWNNAIAAKFDAMIKDASKTFFGRIIEKPIWERMKRRWMSKRLAKQY